MNLDNLCKIIIGALDYTFVKGTVSSSIFEEVMKLTTLGLIHLQTSCRTISSFVCWKKNTENTLKLYLFNPVITTSTLS